MAQDSPSSGLRVESPCVVSDAGVGSVASNAQALPPRRKAQPGGCGLPGVGRSAWFDASSGFMSGPQPQGLVGKTCGRKSGHDGLHLCLIGECCLTGAG
jgi:hypothetical protein